MQPRIYTEMMTSQIGWKSTGQVSNFSSCSSFQCATQLEDLNSVVAQLKQIVEAQSGGSLPSFKTSVQLAQPSRAIPQIENKVNRDLARVRLKTQSWQDQLDPSQKSWEIIESRQVRIRPL